MSDRAILLSSASSRPMPWRVRLAVPVTVFAVLALVLDWGLTTDPKFLPSILIGKPVPVFSLEPVEGRNLGLASADLKGEVSLVNVFASWCTACRSEHPLFMKLKADNVVPIHGLNYKDRPQDAARWLNALGDPYTRTGADQNGRVGVSFQHNQNASPIATTQEQDR
jgi:cytochrome c biogenesis protein CcmG/thiol:disulfide interchange protein DsbE